MVSFWRGDLVGFVELDALRLNMLTNGKKGADGKARPPETGRGPSPYDTTAPRPVAQASH